MFSSKNGHEGRNQNIIKINSDDPNVEIADYATFLEEIDSDNSHRVEIENMFQKEKHTDNDGNFELVSDSSEHSKSEFTRGYEEGFEAGKTEAAKLLRVEYEKKVEGVTSDFAAMASEFSREIQKYNKEYDKAIVTLALAVARRIVAREIAQDKDSVLARSHEAIRKIIGVEKVKIHVNPSDEEYIKEHRSDLSNHADSVREIVIEADNKVERGGCIIESELGNIDARISTQFDLIEEAFLEQTKQ